MAISIITFANCFSDEIIMFIQSRAVAEFQYKPAFTAYCKSFARAICMTCVHIDTDETLQKRDASTMDDNSRRLLLDKILVGART